MNWMRKCKGSISIFLCLILLPMVTYSTMIIDGSRLQTSRVVITNAGDLTMNAALSEYDQILHDMYGLFAVAGADDADPEKFKKSLKAYFEQTIQNEILTVDAEGNFVSNFADWLVNIGFEGGATPDEISDFLKMQVEEFGYEGVDGSELSNPAVMKRQIVDYMKYKGPLSIASTLFKKLDFLKDSGNQTKVVSNKVKYTKALGDMQDPCEVIYKYLVSGEYDGSSPNPFEGETGAPFSYNQLVGDQAAIDADAYLPGGSGEHPINVMIHQKTAYQRYQSVIQDFKYATYFYMLYENKAKFEDSDNWNFTSKNLSELEALVDPADRIEYGFIYDSIPTSGRDKWDIQDDYWRRAGDIENVMNSIVNKNSGAKGCLENLTEDYWMTPNGYSPSVGHSQTTDDNRISYYTVWDNALKRQHLRQAYSSSDNIGTLKENAQNKFVAQYYYNDRKYNMIKVLYYYKLLLELNSKYESALNSFKSWKKSYYDDQDYEDEDERTEDKEEVDRDWEGEYYGVHNIYDACCNNLRTDFTDNIGEIISEARDNSYYTQCANPYIGYAEAEFSRLYYSYKGGLEILEHVKTQLDKIEESIEAAETAKGQWRDSIKNVNSSSIHENMQSDYNSTIDAIDKDAFDKFKAYVIAQIGDDSNPVNMYGIKGVIKRLENLTFNGTKIVDNSGDYENVYNFADLVGKISKDNYNEATDKSDQYVINTSNADESHFKPSSFTLGIDYLEPLEGIETFPMYGSAPDNSNEKFMETIISVATAEKKDMDSGTQQMMDQINSDNDVDDSGKPTGGTADSLGEKPKAASGDPGEAFKDAMDSIIAKYSSSDDGGTLPTGHVSSVEYPDDGKVEEDSNPSGSLDEATGILDMLSNLGATVVNSAYLEEYFTEMFTCQTDAIYVDEANGVTKYSGFNKKLLDPANNWYGKEVEYILWGNDNLNTNLGYNEALIFTIRFALNAIYAFTATDIQSFALEVATALAGWTVIGVPIVQALITLGIALAESAYDLHLLKDGEDVPIYKNAKTFVCSPTGALTTIVEHELTNTVNTVINTATSKVEQYFDGLVDKALDGTYGKIEDVLNDASSGIDSYIEKTATYLSDTVRTAADNLFINPIVNELNPIWAEVHNGASSLHDSVVAHINDAFAEIEGSVGNLNEGLLQTIVQEAMNDSTAYSDLKTNIINTVESYFNDLDDAANTFNPTEIRNAISGDDGLINKFITSKSDSFKDVKQNAIDDIKANLEAHKDEAATNIKNYFHEGVEGVSDSITTGINSSIQESVNNFNASRQPGNDGFSDKNPLEDATDAGVESGGFTLNYKEYCKIFVLIHIAANEDVMLQRAAAIMETNVKSKGKDQFSIVSANTMVSLNAKVKLATLFPWIAQENLDDGSIDPDLSTDLSHIGSNYVNVKYNAITGY